jgi:hypothetical protein
MFDHTLLVHGGGPVIIEMEREREYIMVVGHQVRQLQSMKRMQRTYNQESWQDAVLAEHRMHSKPWCIGQVVLKGSNWSIQ